MESCNEKILKIPNFIAQFGYDNNFVFVCFGVYLSFVGLDGAR